MKPLAPIFRAMWKPGCGVLALALAASQAFGQTAYDPYANSRVRNSAAQSSYGNSDQPQTDAYSDGNANGNSGTIAGRPTNPPPRHYSSAAPRSGSRDFGTQTDDNSNNSNNSNSSSRPADPYSRQQPPPRNPRANASRASYNDQSGNPQPSGGPANYSQPNYSRNNSRYNSAQPNQYGQQNQYGQPGPQYSRPPASNSHPRGFVDGMTAQFNAPAQPADSSYNYRPRHVRTAMVDEPMPTPSNGRTPSSVVSPSTQGQSETVEQLPPGGHPMAHGDINYEYGGAPDGQEPGPGYEEGGPNCGGGCCGGGGCGCGTCGGCGCGPFWCLRQLFCLDCWWNDEWMRDFTVFGGVQGFKGPVDQGVNGDFGFHEGVNWGSPVWDAIGLGMQFGVGEYHSDLSRTNATDEHRNQTFLTVGLFHRPQCGCGFQGGLVFDYLNDSFVDDFSVSQIRGNLSYVFNCHEIGFEFMHGTHDESFLTTVPGATTTATVYHPIDQYLFYFAHHACGGGEGRIFAGFTGGEGAELGADLSVPLSDKISLDTGFAYVIPKNVPAGSLPPEFWNIGINLVWHPGCCASAHDTCSPYRPLFNVADNGSFMVNREVNTRTTASDQ